MLLANRTSDLVEIDAASNRGIEDIRALREQVAYPPLQLKRKIYIIDEVHMLTTEAFNALLKTLEEPPEYCLFILATTEFHKVPLTIRSRCQLIRFERGSMHAIEKKLKSVADKEKLVIDPEVYALLAEHSDGGFRDAETLLETMSTHHTHLTLESARLSLGILPDEQVESLLAACLSGDAELTRKLLSTHTSSLSGSLERLIADIIKRLRKSLFSSGKDTLLHNASTNDITYALEQMLEAYILQKSSPVPSLPLEIACLNVAARSAGHSSPKVLREVSPEAKTPVQNSEKPTIIPPIPKQASEATVPVIELREGHIKDLRKAWRTMIDQVCKENPVLGQSLKQTVFHKAENGVITIHVRYKFHADKMIEKRSRAIVVTLFKELTGEEWEIEYSINPNLPRHQAPGELGATIDDAKAIFGTK
jgi:DNA polymerase-3 subunit gamma/tau